MKKVSERRRKASVIRTCVGLLGPKSGNVEIILVFNHFEASMGPWPSPGGAEPEGFWGLFWVENASY